MTATVVLLWFLSIEGTFYCGMEFGSWIAERKDRGGTTGEAKEKVPRATRVIEHPAAETSNLAHGQEGERRPHQERDGAERRATTGRGGDMDAVERFMETVKRDAESDALQRERDEYREALREMKDDADMFVSCEQENPADCDEKWAHESFGRLYDTANYVLAKWSRKDGGR